MVLTMNNVSLNNEHYLQNTEQLYWKPAWHNRTPVYSWANLSNSLLKPFIWWRLIDHIFMIWTHGEKHLKIFIAGYLNSIHPSIKFTHEYSSSQHQALPFLDVQVHLINNHIQTNLHTKVIKPIDKHQYLLKTSCHPNLNHIKKVIPFSLFLRIRCICSTDTFQL